MATKKRKPAEPKPDPVRELVHELREYVFDDDDFTVPVQLALVEGTVREAASRGLDVERDAVIAICADVMGLDPDELRAEDTARLARFAAAKAAHGRKGEIDALAALRPKKDEYGGKDGLTFDDDAATMLAEAWPRLGGAEFGKKIFGGIKSLHLANFGPLGSLSGLDAAADVKTLTMKLTPGCDLSPVAKRAKLADLQLCGKVEGFAPLAALPKLISLATEANERGIEELAAVPKLRVLTLFVAKNVRVGGLLRLSLKSLNRLDLFAGERELDADLVDTVAALAKRKGKLRLCGGEAWTSAPALIERLGKGSVSLAAGSGYSLINMHSGGYAPIPPQQT
jgi:hypothetical protein